jgi:HEAT repeat protein
MVAASAACQPTRVQHLPPAYAPPRAESLDPQLVMDARHELAQDLHAPDAETRIHAIEGVSLSNSEEFVADIIRGLSDGEPMVRYAAALSIGQLRLADAHAALLAIADDRDEKVRVVVRYALHRLGDVRLSHQLERMSQDPDPAVRGSTALVLGLLGEPSALKILRLLRLDPNPAVRQQASASMWLLHDEDGLADLVGLSISKYPDDEMIGLMGIAAPRDTRVRQYVRNGLTADWPEVALVAARAMGMLGSDEGYGIAMEGARNSDKRQRLLAAFAFGDIGRNDAQDQLRKLLHDADPSVRIAAATAVLELKRHG